MKENILLRRTASTLYRFFPGLRKSDIRSARWMSRQLTAIALAGFTLAVAGCALQGLAPAHHTGIRATFHAPVRVSASRSVCGEPPPVLPGASGDQALISGGVTRSYRVHIPTRYGGDRPVPVMLIVHGDGGSAGGIESYTGMSDLADRADFIAVYPQGMVGRNRATTWATGGPIDPPVDDVAFVADLLDRLEATLCVDARRIYATGFSSGGSMTGILACDLAGRIAAFAPVSGAFYPRSQTCLPERPAPILEVHGNGDPVVPYGGGTLDRLPSIPDWLQQWAVRDGCAASPARFTQSGAATGLRWTGCGMGAIITHYRIAGGGHDWPGSQTSTARSNSPQTIDATAVIWQFCQAYALPQPRGPA